MKEFFTSPFVVFIAVFLVVAAVSGLFAVKDWKRFFSEPKLKNVPAGVYGVFGIMLILGGIMYSCSAKADELKLFSYAEIGAGIDYDKESLFCRNPIPDVVSDDKTTSNIELIANFVEYRRDNLVFDWNFNYSHHSCAWNQDKPTYDAWGTKVKLKLEFDLFTWNF